MLQSVFMQTANLYDCTMRLGDLNESSKGGPLKLSTSPRRALHYISQTIVQRQPDVQRVFHSYTRAVGGAIKTLTFQRVTCQKGWHDASHAALIREIQREILMQQDLHLHSECRQNASLSMHCSCSATRHLQICDADECVQGLVRLASDPRAPSAGWSLRSLQQCS